MEKIAIIGCGMIGNSWASLFLRAGYDVHMWDTSAEALETAAATVADVFRESRNEYPKQANPLVTADLHEALAGATYVQESAPERIDVKRSLYSELARASDDGVILASSTSSFPASEFGRHTGAAGRCLVVHPINPPELIRLVEIVPSSETDPKVVERAVALMHSIGQVPILLRREINGFVANRLQSAVLAEAFRLIEDGVATAADVDTAMTEGLATRWFFMGPFETIDLNAADGIADYCTKLGPMYEGLAQEQADPRAWSESLIAEIEAQRRTSLSEDELGARRMWRDRCLKRLLAAREAVLASEATV